MKHVVWGAFWIVAYLALVLAPLFVLLVGPTPPGVGVWWDFSLALGFAGALPILSGGVVLRLAAPGKRYQGPGEALAGFGLFFLGLAILKDAFGGLADAYGDVVRTGALERFQQTYQRTKASLLASAVAQRLSIETTDALLDAWSATRRMVEQLVKTDRLLRSPRRARDIEAEGEEKDV